MKKFILAWVIFMLTIGGAFAAEPTLKVACVDLGKVGKAYAKQKVLMEELGIFAGELRRDLQARESSLKAIRKKISELAKGTPERLELEMAFRKGADRYPQLRREHEISFRKRESRIKRIVLSDICREIELIAKVEEYDFIFERASDLRDLASGGTQSQRLVLFAKEKYDISDRVIAAVNAAYKKEKAADDAARKAPAPKTDK
jgi:Skp family chaperone for outer membrane proteins